MRSIIAALVMCGGLVACSSSGESSHGASVPTASTDVADGVGLRLRRATLTDGEAATAQTWATTYLAALAQDHPALQGMTIESLTPVFDETTPEPIGAMARFVTPVVVPEVVLDLVRSKGGRPDPVTSTVTNLRALEAIYMFVSASVVHLGISPQRTDAADPASATQVAPVDPTGDLDPDFGGRE